jgi:hypothetical protein
MNENNDIIVVLDLDNTLIHSVTKDVAECIHKPADLIFSDIYVYFRPYLAAFLNELKSKFNRIGIWSFGTDDYVNKIASVLGIEFEFIYSINNPPPGKQPNDFSCKELIYIEQNHMCNAAFMIDDRPINGSKNIEKFINIRPFYIHMYFSDKELYEAYNELIGAIKKYKMIQSAFIELYFSDDYFR